MFFSHPKFFINLKWHFLLLSFPLTNTWKDTFDINDIHSNIFMYIFLRSFMLPYYDRFYKVQIENLIFILSFRFVKLLKYGNMHVETEKVSSSYIHRYSWPCRWGYELSFWRQRGVVMAWRIGRSCICLFWSNWTGNAV